MSFFSDASADLTEAFTYTRLTRTAGSNGRAAGPSGSAVPGAGVFEPLSGREKQRLPEGERDRNWKTLWTSTVLATGDQIAYAGKQFEVAAVGEWNVLGGYNDAKIVEIES